MKKYDLVICAIACGEEDYIAEWIEFHLLQGVEHFYLNINNPIDKTPEILNRYKDVVTLSYYPLEGGDLHNVHLWQLKAYDELVKLARPSAEWVAIIDVDEFLWSPTNDLTSWDRRGNDSLVYNLQEFNDRGIGCVAVKWHMFGDSGNRTRTPGLVIERFTKRQNGTHPHCKSVFKSSHYLGPGGDCHTVSVKGLIVNERKRLCPKDTYAVDFKPGTAELLCINHYHIKTYEECLKRVELRKGKATEIKDFEIFYNQDNYNDVEDRRLVKFAETVKLRMVERGL